MRRVLGFTLVITVLLVAPVLAEWSGQKNDLIRKFVFGPELLIAHQREIGLTPEQRETFIREMQQTQSDLLPTQMEMSEASADLIELLEGPRVDEAAALAAAQRVLDLEMTVKSRHAILLIRIKNLLTEEQQKRLREIRDAS